MLTFIKKTMNTEPGDAQMHTAPVFVFKDSIED